MFQAKSSRTGQYFSLYFSLLSFSISVTCIAIYSVAGSITNAAEETKVLHFQVPNGLPQLPVPDDNPMDPAKIELGKMLYFDARLSSDDKISCASCHHPEKGWSNDDTFATGVGGQRGGRSAPTVLNSAYHQYQFWDGRAATLEEQALGPIQNPIEMNMTLDAVVEKLKKIPGYQTKFKEVFGTEVNSAGIAKSIAAFERTILSGNAPYDKFVAGDKTALSEKAQKGLALFNGKAHCSACHSGPNFTDNAFHNIGVAFHASTPDHGRVVISKISGDTGAFKTPTLREIKRTAPYMHDGSEKTLKDVIAYYNKGGTDNEFLDEEIYALKLSNEEIDAIVTFMEEGLTSADYPMITPPKLPE
jgi:cytochrome c peroxidase